MQGFSQQMSLGGGRRLVAVQQGDRGGREEIFRKKGTKKKGRDKRQRDQLASTQTTEQNSNNEEQRKGEENNIATPVLEVPALSRL